MHAAEVQQHRYALDPDTKAGRLAIQHYMNKPVDFIDDLVLRDLDGNRRTDPHGNPLLIHETQAHALTLLAEGKWPIISAGRGVGKTAILAWSQMWWMYTHPTARIPVISVKQEQLKKNVWPEIAKWLDMAMFKDDFVWEKMKIHLKGREQKVYSFMLSGVTRESFQGVHDDFMLVQCDEASGIPDEVFEAMLGSLTQQGNAAMLFGNPTKSSGFFIDTFEKPNGRWVPIHIPCVQENGVRHPNVTAEFVENTLTKYGEDHNTYRVYVLGLKPKTDADAIIPWEWVNNAQFRDVQGTDMYRVVWGLDVARYGDDMTALAKRQGNIMPEPVILRGGLDTMQVANWIKMEYEDLLPDKRPSEIMVDVIGIGAGVHDRLREFGLPVRGINTSESGSSTRRFARLRDELWWRAREWFESRAVKIAEDQELLKQLSALKYDDRTGKVKVEGKMEFKKRNPFVGSPDAADAFVLTFAGGLDKIEDHAIDRYKLKRRPEVRSWLAA